MHLLRQVGGLEPDALANRARVRLLLAQQDLEQRGLARAVRAQQRDLFAVADVERDVV